MDNELRNIIELKRLFEEMDDNTFISDGERLELMYQLDAIIYKETLNIINEYEGNGRHE